MNVLFVVPDTIKMELLSIELLSACLKRAGHATRLAYSNHPDFWRRAGAFRPDLAAFSVTTGMHHGMALLAGDMKRRLPGLLTVFGGPHATFHPGMIEEYPGVDALCRGEGEAALVALAGALQGGRDHSRIPNLWVRAAGGVVRNPLGAPAELDGLPFYDRDLFAEADPDLSASTTRAVMVSRGCPYSCSYCYNRGYKALYGPAAGLARAMSVPRAIAELKRLLLSAPRTRFIEFHDDIFPYSDDERLEEFADLYRREIGLEFFTYLPPARGGRDFIARLKRAGCGFLGIGLECGDEAVRREVLRRPRYSNADVAAAVGACRELGIRSLTTNLVGLPVADCLRTDLGTLAVNIAARPTLALSYLAQPYPGTELAEIAVRGGFFRAGARIDFNNKADSPLDFPEGRTAIEKTALMFGLLLLLPKGWWAFLYLAHRGFKFNVVGRGDYSLGGFLRELKAFFRYLRTASAEKQLAQAPRI
ncbi:MAG: B12-binding domain-containing radical SAM protein [Elusimicrobia bacterium]|nr:B12-binding domain-containing radical SAM protein [Elusimicrobiota bacterium]